MVVVRLFETAVVLGLSFGCAVFGFWLLEPGWSSGLAANREYLWQMISAVVGLSSWILGAGVGSSLLIAIWAPEQSLRSSVGT